MHYKALTPSPFLAAGDLGGPDFPQDATFEIVGESFDQLPSMKPGAKADDKETKGLIRLRFNGEIVKPWIANKTNTILIAKMLGEDTDGWRGHRVTLHAVPVKVGPKTEPGIRVKGSPEIDRAVTVEIKFRGRKAETFTLVPTGDKPTQTRRPANETTPFTLATWKQALTTAGHDPDKVIAWLGTLGADVTAFLQGEYTAVLADIAPNGARRVEFDAYLAR